MNGQPDGLQLLGSWKREDLLAIFEAVSEMLNQASVWIPSPDGLFPQSGRRGQLEKQWNVAIVVDGFTFFWKGHDRSPSPKGVEIVIGVYADEKAYPEQALEKTSLPEPVLTFLLQLAKTFEITSLGIVGKWSKTPLVALPA